MRSGLSMSPSQLSEELRLGPCHQLRAYAELEVLQEFAKSGSVDEVNGRRSISYSLAGCIPREPTRRHEQTLVCSTDHCASEVSDLLRGDRTSVPLALKSHVKRDEIDPKHPRPVDASVARAARHLDLREAGFAQHTLTQTFERVRLQAKQDGQQAFRPVAAVRRLRSLGSAVGSRLDPVTSATPALPTDKITQLLFRRNRPSGRSDRPTHPVRLGLA